MAKSSEMPAPQVINYDISYKLTPLFINDLKKVMADVPYVDAIKLFNMISECDGVMHIARFNEFLRELGSFPFKYVSGIMSVINNKEYFPKYFDVVLPKPREQRGNATVNEAVKTDSSK